MSEFDDFFERERENALVSRFNYREPISFHHLPTYLRILDWEKYPRYLPRLVTGKAFLKIENLIFRNRIIEVSVGSQTRYFAPNVAYGHFRTLDRRIMNYRLGNEPELAHLIDLLIPANGTFVDAGANWGYFSFYLYFRENFRGRIHGFEPLPQNFSIMSAIKKQFCKDDDRFKISQVALSDKESTAKFYVYDAQHSTLQDPSDEVPAKEVIHVQTRRLDSFEFDKIDFLKIDVEGSENECLAGAESHIKRFLPYIFLESDYAGDTRENIEHALEPFYFLERLGYRFFLPAWVQEKRSFFVGIGWKVEMGHLALTPFKPEDRGSFGISILNIFACHESKTDALGTPFRSYFN